MIFRPLAAWVMPAIIALVRGGAPSEDPLTDQEVGKIGKIITWLIGIMTVELLVTAFIFRFLVAGEVKDLQLTLARDYARRTEVVTHTEFDQTMRDINRRMDQPVPISREADVRLRALENQNADQNARILALEHARK